MSALVEKKHLYAVPDIVVSALTGVEASAACGFRKVLSRKAFEDGLNPDLPGCDECHAEAAKTDPGDDFTERKSKTWEELLENAFRALLKVDRPVTLGPIVVQPIASFERAYVLKTISVNDWADDGPKRTP